jgi:hypothetical protein
MPEVEQFPLKITPYQREALISGTRLKAAIKRKLGAVEERPQVIGFTRKELDHMRDELGEAAVFVPDPYKKRIVAVHRKVEEILDELQAEEAGTRPAKPRPRPASPDEVLFEFRITLQDVEPPIWRRVQVEDGTLGDLHEIIQVAFGWENCHLHQFVIDGVRYGPVFPDEVGFDMGAVDQESVRLSDIIPPSGKRFRFRYEYDFGDGWRHDMLFEGYPPRERRIKYPVCMGGERACPPDDVGGPWGYVEYLAAISDPRHAQHQELLEWSGPFDPEAFDAARTTKALRRMFRKQKPER